VRLDLERCALDRDAVMGEMGNRKIGVGLHFTPVHLHRFYAEKYGYARGDLPATEAAGEEMFSLPLYPLLTPGDQERVVATLRAVCASAGATSVAASRGTTSHA
jgi:dTDP-4-amino-4,6-dideoxygalactose transaminase